MYEINRLTKRKTISIKNNRLSVRNFSGYPFIPGIHPVVGIHGLFPVFSISWLGGRSAREQSLLYPFYALQSIKYVIFTYVQCT